MCLALCGCGSDIPIENPYDIGTSATNASAPGGEGIPGDGDVAYFADSLCVAEADNTKADDVAADTAEAVGVFLPASKEVAYQKNLYKKMYPASTTKIMTAYLAITQSDLEDEVTVSEHAVDQSADSSVCGLKAGDRIKMKDLLYGLILPSGNDAAVAIAEHVSGSEEKFVDLMNETARSFGATNTHFVNPNGLQDEDHYTCVYDLYLILSRAIEQDFFIQLIQTASYTAYYVDASGAEASQSWSNTNKYMDGTVAQPEDVTVIGGKTGTTNAAGYCLALIFENSKKETGISIILKSDGRSNLYYVMNQLLANFAN